ncbi:hypothetical protein [Klebsiella sp. KG9]|uniref:hypothetical protein n=1 Tax=Klebsiella sp. KG9 TaxID=2044270 RepID=UPI000BF3C24F|nr:hypothetical protein [Klebsiella sp. KG9]PEX89649.1 hypothetical protein CRI71_04075 [Klebsiella sp. KG9]
MTEAELALERAKKLAFLMTERFSMNPISAKLLNEAWRLAFPDEVAVARRMRALVEALEKAQTKNALVAGGIEATAKLHERIAELEEAEQKLCAANVTLDARAELAERRLAEMESRTVTIEPFRSFVTDADLAALHRFAECCDDPESGGHDLEQEQVRRLEAIGALQRSGRISYITSFGDVLISITAGIKWEAK